MRANMRLLGVFGHPIGHSLSPVMHQAALEKIGLQNSFTYLPFDVRPDQLPAAVAAIRALNMRGVNVTIPHKENVLPLLDHVQPEAILLGAVNTIVNDDGRLIGYNTDGQGFLRSMLEETGVSPAGQKILIVGAGGACRAVAAALFGAGAARLIIANRNRQRAEGMARMIEPQGSRVQAMDLIDEHLDQAIADAQILINTTSLGMTPALGCPLAEHLHLLHPGQLVCDIVYRPRNTPWLQAAAAAGCQTMGGLGMLLYQGAAAFQLWTGQPAPVAEMRQALTQAL